jgi:hypothetical protein
MKILADVRKNGFAVNDQEARRGTLPSLHRFFFKRWSGDNPIAEPEDASIDVLKRDYAPKRWT